MGGKYTDEVEAGIKLWCKLKDGVARSSACVAASDIK